MSIIFDVDLNADLTEFTSTVTDSGDLAWSNNATAQAVASSAGAMSALIDDSTAIYGECNLVTSNTSGVVRYRAYIDPNSLTMANTNSFYWLVAYNSSSASFSGCKLGYTDAGGLRLQGYLTEDSGTETTINVNITDAPHYVEIKVTRSTGADANDAHMEWWIDGVEQTAITGKDCYTRFANFDAIRLGAIIGIDAGTSGTFYLDELVVNDDGGEIGPVSTGRTATLSKTLDNVTSSSSGKASNESDLSKTLSAATNSSVGKVSIVGTEAKTLGTTLLSSSGANSNLADASKTLDNATESSSGKVSNSTDLSATLESIENVASGTGAIGSSSDNDLSDGIFSSEADVPIVSNLSKTLDDVILSSNGIVGVSTNTANLNITLDSITNVSGGTNAIGGDTNETLGTDTFDAEADASIYGNSSNTLADSLFSSSGYQGLKATGTLDVTLAAVTLIATGIVTPLPISTFLPKWKYNVPYYDRHFDVSEYNRTNVIEKDRTFKLEDTEG